MSAAADEIAVAALAEIGIKTNGTRVAQSVDPRVTLKARNLGRTAVGLEPWTLDEYVAHLLSLDDYPTTLWLHRWGLEHPTPTSAPCVAPAATQTPMRGR